MRSATHGKLVANVSVFFLLIPRMIETEMKIVYNYNKSFSVRSMYD